MIVRSPIAIAGAAIIAMTMGTGALYFLRSSVQTEDSATPLIQKIFTVRSKGFNLPPQKNTAFSAGEKLSYDIIYKGITVGHATIGITDGPPVNGRQTLKYISKAESTHFFDFFFKVRDENISTVDKASLFSLTFDQNLHEGDYLAVRHYNFDYMNKKFTAEEKNKGKIKKNTGPRDAPLYDVLSALYFARTRDLSPGRDLSLPIYRDESRKILPVKVGSAPKNQKTPLGTFSCLRVEPVINGDSIFNSKDGRLVVWMTNDERKLPLIIEARIPVGLVRIKLTKWEKQL